MRDQRRVPLLLLLTIILSKTEAVAKLRMSSNAPFDIDDSYCLSWRLAVEANNVQPWRTVPEWCLLYVESYMLGGQYERDLDIVVNEIFEYLSSIVPGGDGMDAWVLDVDDTCISNLSFYQGKRFGGDPFDPLGFKNWAMRGACPAIPQILRLYWKLIDSGFKVFLITGRDEELLGPSTAMNLFMQGFIGHEKLIMRNSRNRGQSARIFKSSMRRELEAEGYRIHGNVGDQWSDLTGDFVGFRTFKLPNPMYFVP